MSLILGVIRKTGRLLWRYRIPTWRQVERRLREERREIGREIDRRVEEEGRRVLDSVYASAQRTHHNGQPRLDPLALALRQIAVMRWSIKSMGAKLAKDLYESGRLSGPSPSSPERIDLRSKLCCQADIESDWLRYWCDQLRVAPVYSRKIWEYGFVLQAIWEAGFLEAGRCGLGFAVGREQLPSYFASREVRVLATDLAGSDERSRVWQDTDQHASDVLEGLYFHDLVNRESFARSCSFRSVDMNHIPDDLHGKFDFCWSMCSFEHVGSLEQGLEFVRNSVKCLRPGGCAVHTTEFSFEQTDETTDNWPTVLFQRRHIDELQNRLARDGHHLISVDYNPGDGDLDIFVDVPPYSWDTRPLLTFPPAAPQIRLSVDGFPVTSIGLIVRAKG
jgi:SAM-dependent methyltransferase